MHVDSRAITLGGLFLVGLAAGPLGLDLFPVSTTLRFPFVADLALVMVAFLLGGELTPELLREHGRAIISISVVVVVITAASVSAGLLALGWSLGVALLFGPVFTRMALLRSKDVPTKVTSVG